MVCCAVVNTESIVLGIATFKPPHALQILATVVDNPEGLSECRFCNLNRLTVENDVSVSGNIACAI